MEANELSCKDLMVGDWIKPKNVDVGFRVGLIGVDSVWNDTDTHELDYDEIEPIPLTPEILEKNFESESNIFGLQTYKLNENFNLEDRGDRFCLVRKCNDYSSSTFWICDLTYLHQLQHALRLCEIEKEIEL